MTRVLLPALSGNTNNDTEVLTAGTGQAVTIPNLVSLSTGLSWSGNELVLGLTKALLTATGLSYSDVGADQAGAAAAVNTALNSLTASGVPYDDSGTSLGASDVQDAIVALASLISAASGSASTVLSFAENVAVGFVQWQSGTGWGPRPVVSGQPIGKCFWFGPGVSKGNYAAGTYYAWDIVVEAGLDYAYVGAGGAASPPAPGVGTAETTWTPAHWQNIATLAGDPILSPLS